jgi:hypothetical protein
MRSNKYVSENETVLVTFSGPITTAEIWDRKGIYARGNAKYNPEDDYTESFGQALALARATSRYFRKVEKKLVRSTK